MDTKVKVRNVAIDINTARKWYNNGDESLRVIALQVFSENELNNNVISYEDICNELFKCGYYYVSDNGGINYLEFSNDSTDPNNASSRRQLEKLLAINKLMNVAKYLNKGVTPTFKYFIYIDSNNEITVGNRLTITEGTFFTSEENARKAIKILGEDVIRLALVTDY